MSWCENSFPDILPFPVSQCPVVWVWRDEHSETGRCWAQEEPCRPVPLVVLSSATRDTDLSHPI